MAANFDRADILRTYQLFHDPGDTVELRIPKAGRYKTISGYFNSSSSFADAVVGLADEEFAGYYFTLNEVNPDLFARSANAYKRYAEETTADKDITRRRWLPVDFDVIRPAGISSTDEEHTAALEMARNAKEWLISSKGWPENAFILADSGNGGHLDIRIDLPNDEGAKKLIENCLSILGGKFSNGIVKVDTTTVNAARIWKIYGTMCRKGSNTADRPHRLAKILEAPEELATVPRELLEELVSQLPKTEPIVVSQSQSFDPVKYAEDHGAKVTKVKHGWTGPTGRKWTLAILEECPFDSNHNRGESWIGVREDGLPGFSCPHDGCRGNDWFRLMDKWEPDWKPTYEDYNPPLTRERCDQIEARTGIHAYNAIDDPNPNSISEEELEAFKLPDGPKFECKLPKDHFIQRFIAYGTEVSDAYPDYWLAGALYALAVMADKKIKVVLRIGPIYPNLYISINGKSSLARKSTAVDITEEIILKALPQMLPAMVPTEFSPEAFIEHLSTFQHAPWIRDEAAGVLSLMKKDYMRGFKDSLMSLFDCKPFHRKLRTTQRKGSQTDFNVADPYLNLFWATTGASLGANTDQNDTVSGFLARFDFFFPQGMKPRFMPLEEGTPAISMFEDVIVSQLKSIATKMSELSECTALHISPDAAAYYNRWQETREREWIATDDGAAMQIFSRLNPTIVKLGMLFELGAADFDISKPIRLEFIEEACRLVDEYLMPTARAVYDLVGANADKNDIDKIINYLKQHNGKGSRREIMRYVKIKRKDFDDYVFTMIESEMVDEKIVDNEGKGRNTTYLFLRDNSKVTNVSKVPSVPSVPKIPRPEGIGDSRDTGDVGDVGDGVDTRDIEDELQQAEERQAAKEAKFKTPVFCVVCGEDLTGKGQLTKGGKVYCPKPGCGYPQREAEA